MNRALGLGFALGSGDGARGFDFGGDRMPPGASLTRASPASVVDASGVLRQAAADSARFDHTASGARRGLLVERAATNHVTASADISTWVADYGRGASPIGTFAGDAPAPDGSQSAARFEFEHNGGYARLLFYPTVTAAGDYCFSIWLRAPTAGRSIAMSIDNALSPALMLGPQWQRLFVTASGAVPTQCQLILWPFVADTPDRAIVHAWGAQFETGLTPSSYIATGTAPVTRAPDVLTLDWRGTGVADGPRPVRFSFDDDSSAVQTLTVSGGRTVVPSTLPRSALRRVERA